MLASCIGILANTAPYPQAHAQPPAGDLHPILGQTPPREVLNRDILTLPSRERTAWIHGAMSQMVQVYAHVKPDAAQCLSAWGFDRGNGLYVVSQYMKSYPDQLASVTMLAIAQKACSDI